MAVALRPAVLLIAIASLLFIAAGWVDSSSALDQCRITPSSDPCVAIAISTIESWIFGVVNLLVALLIARGSERILALRIGLAAFFMFERPVTALTLGPKPIESVILHFATAILEAVILISTMRLWRLGHSVTATDIAFLALGPTPIAAMGTAAQAEATVAVAPARGRSAGMPAGWGIGLLALLLSAALIADPVARGAVPGAAVDVASPVWLGYVLALLVLAVAVRAVHRGRLALRLMLVVSLIVILERALLPLALGSSDLVSLALRSVAAVLGLVLAIASVASLRRGSA